MTSCGLDVKVCQLESCLVHVPIHLGACTKQCAGCRLGILKTIPQWLESTCLCPLFRTIMIMKQTSSLRDHPLIGELFSCPRQLHGRQQTMTCQGAGAGTMGVGHSKTGRAWGLRLAASNERKGAQSNGIWL